MIADWLEQVGHGSRFLEQMLGSWVEPCKRKEHGFESPPRCLPCMDHEHVPPVTDVPCHRLGLGR